MSWFARLLIVMALLPASLAAADSTIDAATAAETSPSVSKVLVPVLALGQPGANGSVWDTQLWVCNTSDQPIVYYFGSCSVACCCDEINTYPPQETQLVELIQPHGQWFEFPVSGFLQIHARFRDRSRESLSAGVELPVVRTDDFFSGELNFIGIPRNSRFRVMLRLYSLEAGVSARIDQIDHFGQLIRQESAYLDPPGPADVGGIPAYAQIAVAPSTTEDAPLRLRATSLRPETRFWGFVSVTNNETSEVTIIQPSR